jgi:hypothetical protein
MKFKPYENMSSVNENWLHQSVVCVKFYPEYHFFMEDFFLRWLLQIHLIFVIQVGANDIRETTLEKQS